MVALLRICTLSLFVMAIFMGCGDTIRRDGNTMKQPEDGAIAHEISEESLDISTTDEKKIFIIGDSTVHNTTVENNVRVNYGWGDMLAKYMHNPKNLFNLAEPGTSSKSYQLRSDLEYDGYFHNWFQTKALIQSTDLSSGGYLFIQFGHNDETDEYKEDDIHTLPGMGDSFYNNLKFYIRQAYELGLTPVLITPLERMEKPPGENTKQSHIRDTGDYAQTVRDLSKQENILLLDLQKTSWKKFNQYYDTFALEDKFGFRDSSEHLNEEGANIVAGWVKELICRSKDKVLCSQFD